MSRTFPSPIGAAILILTGGLLLSGCQSDPGPKGLHPRPALVPHHRNVDHTIHARSSSAQGAFSALRKVLTAQGQQIGVREGGGPTMFGSIEDAIIDGRDRVLVLDSENKEVRVFSVDGTYVGSFGRRGGGPGEFKSPSHLVQFGDGSVAVLDRKNGVQIFEVSGQSYEFSREFDIGLAAQGACTLGDTLYVQEFSQGEPTHSIFAFSRNGKRVRAMGPVYQSDDPLVRGQVTEGPLACDQATGTIVFAFRRAPILYGYRPSGSLRWTARIRPFDADKLKRTTRDGAPAVQYPDSPQSDRIWTVEDAPGPGVLVQRFRSPPEDGDRTDVVLHTYWVSAADGSGTSVGAAVYGDSPAGMVHDVSEQSLVSVRPIPFPRLRILPVSGVEWEP